MTDSQSPLIISVAPNGAYKTLADHPAVPLTAAAMAATARACLQAGAAMLHMHVREPSARHSLDVTLYRESLAAVHQAVGDEMLVQVTSEAAGRYGSAEQAAMVRALHPRALSVALREISAAPMTVEGLATFFGWLAAEDILTQVILYDVNDVLEWQRLRAQGVVPAGSWSVLFVLGRYSAGQVSSPADLLPFLAAFDGGMPWMMCAFGALEHACAITAAALGGHARVGFENNLWCKDGTLAPHNAALVEQVVQGAQALGRPLATAAQARALFGAR